MEFSLYSTVYVRVVKDSTRSPVKLDGTDKIIRTNRDFYYVDGSFIELRLI